MASGGCRAQVLLSMLPVHIPIVEYYITTKSHYMYPVWADLQDMQISEKSKVQNKGVEFNLLVL